MQANLTRQQVIHFRGGDCLIFLVGRPFSQKDRKIRLLMPWIARPHCNLALVAVASSSLFSILFSQTIRVPLSPQLPTNPSRPSPSLVRIVARCTTTFWGHSFCWRNSSMADERPRPDQQATGRLLSLEQMQIFTGSVCIHLPMSQEYLVVHKDRAARVFTDWRERIRGKSAWQTPLGICLSLAVTLASASFKDFSWISAGTLRGAFLTACLLSGVWFAIEVVRAIRTPGASAEQFIECLAEGTKKTDYGVSQESANEPNWRKRAQEYVRKHQND